MIGKAIRGGGATVALVLTAALTLFPGGPHPGPARAAERVGGDFALERVDLRFVGGEKTKVVAAGHQVRAEAEIIFTGAGELGGDWEIAEPGTTSGNPRFRTLELVGRLLGSGRREVLSSPPLPTVAVGAYLLRLRITQPKSAGPPLVIRYFVGAPGQAAAGQTGDPGTIVARGPAAGGPADGPGFAWQAVAGSIAYQLEIYEKDGAPGSGGAGQREGTAGLLVTSPAAERPPVAGVIVPGSETGVSAARAFGDKLAPGRKYVWRVVAIGAEGRLLSESTLQELFR